MVIGLGCYFSFFDNVRDGDRKIKIFNSFTLKRKAHSIKHDWWGRTLVGYSILGAHRLASHFNICLPLI